jgi:regulator of protease activity HflC (stomatin/prohibitin superfamily)
MDNSFDFTVILHWAGLAGLVLVSLIFLVIALRVNSEWDRAVILRLGRFHRLAGPGFFVMIPFIDSIAGDEAIDMRVSTSEIEVEKAMTKDTVPVRVDAVLFWQVVDAKKAVLEVEDYADSIDVAATTALRDVIGSVGLSTLLSARDSVDAMIQQRVAKRAEAWGIAITGVELRDVSLPDALTDAMSRQAQAERERQARSILADSESEIAQRFVDAAKIYEQSPFAEVAVHLRGMNMLYEGLKEKGALMVVPSSALQSMDLGGIAGLASLKEK